MAFLRIAAAARPVLRTSVTRAVAPRFVAVRNYSDSHEESFEEFTARYEKEFDAVQDVFELQRNLNNAFAYDLVPSVSVITAALKAARRVNDFPTAVRVFEGTIHPSQLHFYSGLPQVAGILLGEAGGRWDPSGFD
ncbi:cytochrome c oxidase subunit VA-domain-containing protein, partial [Pyronema omphalodes]